MNTLNTTHRIRIFDGDSPSTRSYCVTDRLTFPIHCGNYTFTQRNLPLAALKGVTAYAPDKVRQTITDLLRLPGVVAVGLSPYQLDVRIGRAFDFADLHEDIVRCFKMGIFLGSNMEIQDRTTPSAAIAVEALL